jgi:hypothetical protein
LPGPKRNEEIKLEIIELRDGGDGDIVSYMAKGHVDRIAFIEQIELKYGDQISRTESVEHIWARWLPRPDWGFKSAELVQAKRGLGAFAATYVEIEFTESAPGFWEAL